MKKVIGVAVLLAMSPMAALAGGSKPIVLNKAEVAGGAFNLPEAKTYTHHGNTVHDLLMLMTADRKYEAGMYKSGPAHFSVTGTKTYGVNEFMYFLKGEVTLTSADGTVQHIHAGEAVVIPADWQGTWDTKGYTKFYAIYAPKGNAD